MSPNLVKYKELKNNISSAKDHVRWKTYHDGDYYSSYSSDAMTDEQLEKKIKEMRDKVEAEIEQLRAQNKKNVAGRDEAIKDLEKKEKELDDFLKSKGIRESILSIINSHYLKESDNLENDDIDESYLKGFLFDLLDTSSNADIYNDLKTANNLGDLTDEEYKTILNNYDEWVDEYFNK